MFSVIIPTRDRASTLTRILEAVEHQSHPAEQVVVVDDGSVDDTAAVLAGRPAPKLDIVRTTGVGVSCARNAGLAMARSEWVVFIDDDDLPTPDWLEVLARWATAEAGVVCCGFRLHWSDRTETRSPDVLTGEPVESFLAGTFAVRRSIIDDVGGYRDGLTFAENTELAMRLLPRCEALGFDVVGFPDPLVDLYRADVRPSTKGRRQAIVSVMDTHADLFAAQPRRHARWLNVAAVDAWREGDRRACRTYLRRAARVRPADLRTWGRLVAASVPLLGARVWSTRRSSGTAGSVTRSGGVAQ